MELRGELKLLHSSMLIDNCVLVWIPSERKQLVIMVNGEFRSVISQVLHDLLVRRVLAGLVRPFEVRKAVMLC